MLQFLKSGIDCIDTVTFKGAFAFNSYAPPPQNFWKPGLGKKVFLCEEKIAGQRTKSQQFLFDQSPGISFELDPRQLSTC